MIRIDAQQLPVSAERPDSSAESLEMVRRLMEQARTIVLDARQEATRIVAEARRRAEAIESEARRKGYAEGLARADDAAETSR